MRQRNVALKHNCRVWRVIRQTVEARGTFASSRHIQRPLPTVVETAARRRRNADSAVHRRGAGHGYAEVGQGRQGRGRHAVRRARPGARQALQVPSHCGQLRRTERAARYHWGDPRQGSIRYVVCLTMTVVCEATASVAPTVIWILILVEGNFIGIRRKN